MRSRAGKPVSTADKSEARLAVIFLGLGSNLGDRQQNIVRAIEELKAAGIEIEKVSALMETDPVGGPPQDKYLNAVLKASTIFLPKELLREIQTIEKKLGRIRNTINGPRPIDVDILLYDRLEMQSPELTIPHPRMFDRDFVMVPLKQIEPAYREEFLYENNSNR